MITYCLNNHCPQAQTCRRYVYALNTTSDTKSFRVFNPAYLKMKGVPCSADSATTPVPQEDEQRVSSVVCPHYISTDLVRYAKGFIGILNSLSVSDLDCVRTKLMLRYHRKNYYKYRKGELLLPPDEQQFIMDLVSNYFPEGKSVDFDGYVEQ